jgi:phosphatidylglycerol:prolipoprotein diacylglycerol transferase
MVSGITISIDPVLFRIGPLQLRWYGLFVATAMLAGYALFMHRLRARNLPADQVSASFLWIAAAGFLGARAFHVIDRWGHYTDHPLEIINLQQGGLAIWGGIVCGTAAAVIIYRARGLPLAAVADAAVPALLVGQMIGRLGCIVNGDAYGGVTDLPWGFIYTHPGALLPDDLLGVKTHPYPVYEMLWNGASLVILLLLERHSLKKGRLFLAYLALYSTGRLLLSSVRLERFVLGELQQSQAFAIAVLLLSFGAWIIIRAKEAKQQP